MRIFDLCLSQCWAITPEALATILAIANRDDLPLQAVEAAKGRALDNTHTVTYRNGVAILPIEGSIVRHGDMFSDVSGAVSVNTLARDFTTALNDASVHAILLAIDSPGGEINGISEFSNMIYAGRKVKPITAYISSLGASAAYWIASACSEIVADATAQIGSIGVVGAMPNPEKDSKRTVEFVSSQSPHKRADISTDRGRAQIQARVDALADVFVAAVARNRKVTQATVLSDFGGGGIFVGKAAVKAGLIDRIGSFEHTLAALVAGKDDAADVAAQDTGGTIVAEETSTKQRKGFWAWMGGANGDAPENDPPEHGLSAVSSAHLEDPRIAQLQAQLAATQERQFSTEASAFVEGLVRGARALPAEAAALKDLYVQAARDDAAAGDTARVGKLTLALSARQPHTIVTGERLKGQFALVPNQLTTGSDQAAELDEDEADAREWAKKRNERALR